MPHIEGEIVIRRPVEDVFDFCADERNEPGYNPDMVGAEKLSPGPIGCGTRFRERMTVGGRTVEMTTVWTGYDRPRRLASTTRLPAMEIVGALTFDAVPQGTLMRWAWEVRTSGRLRLLAPMIALTGGRQELARWTSLKRFLEEGAASSPA